MVLNDLDYVQVTTTGPRADLDKIAKALVEDRLAACVQVAGPIHSTYRWRGKVEEAEEWLAIIKTTRDLYADVQQTILHLHSYEVPEILAVPVVAGSPDYLAWLARQLKDST